MSFWRRRIAHGCHVSHIFLLHTVLHLNGLKNVFHDHIIVSFQTGGRAPDHSCAYWDNAGRLRRWLKDHQHFVHILSENLDSRASVALLHDVELRWRCSAIACGSSSICAYSSHHSFFIFHFISIYLSIIQ